MQTGKMVLLAGLAMTAAATAQVADQSRANASELLADSGLRASSLAPQAQDFTVNVHGFTQFRFNWNSRDDQGLDANDNDQTIGFQNARTKLQFSGNIANENWGYYVQFKFEDPSGGAGTLDDAYGTYKMGDGWNLKFGQFKLPLYKEESMSDTAQLFANRSASNAFFTQSRSQGVQVAYEADQFRFHGAVSDGLVTRNTDYTSGSESDISLTARGEYKWAGDWKQAKDFTSFQNSEMFGSVGGAINYQTGGSTVGTTDATQIDVTADVQIEGNGWNGFAAFGYRDRDPDVGTKTADLFFLIQGGVFVSADWELVGGWDILVPDSDYGSPGDSNFSTIRLGVNHYFVPESHAVKLTIDWSYFLDAQSETAIAGPNTQVGLLPSSEDTQWNLRAQIQLVF